MANLGRGDRAGGRTGHHGLHRLAYRQICGHDPPVSLHHQQAVRETVGRKLVGQSTKVSRQHGLDERIDRRSATAFELAHFAKDLAADRDVFVGPDLARDLGGALLVCGIDVTVQKLKDNRLGAEFQQLLQGIPDLIFIE